jgi:hypothetical protein
MDRKEITQSVQRDVERALQICPEEVSGAVVDIAFEAPQGPEETALSGVGTTVGSVHPRHHAASFAAVLAKAVQPAPQETTQ